ncbi:MAG TPA: histidine kinase dimerization/phosphoacceptor domain -containing protein [Rectinemataceae bacterium]|nr:histidine kinase dimerization/phosphoacceptor domain -containing protein [Rectinemataceae bacterium]
MTGAAKRALSARLSIILEATADLNTMLTDTKALYASLLGRLSRAVPFNSGSIQVMENQEARIVAFLGNLDPDIVMDLRFPMDPLYPNFRVVTERRPIGIADTWEEYPHFLTRKEEFGSGGIRSWLGVPMIVSGEVIGMIALDRNVVDPFLPEDVRIVQGFANHAAVAIQNSITYRRLEEALTAKDRLMMELHHRVKNNLQMIASFISIQSGLIESEGHRALLEELDRRIESIAAAHERLNGHADPGAGVDLALYLRDICEDFKAAFIGLDAKVSLELELEHLSADIAKAVPLGLILNELLTNAHKYAFPGESSGKVAIGLRREGGEGVLTVEDSGIGFAASEDPGRRGGGFGTQLVHGLADQLGGAAELASSPGRTIWTLRFKAD